MNAIQSLYAETIKTYDYWLKASCADSQNVAADDACWKAANVFYKAEMALITWARQNPSAEVQARISAEMKGTNPQTQDLDALCAYLMAL